MAYHLLQQTLLNNHHHLQQTTRKQPRRIYTTMEVTNESLSWITQQDHNHPNLVAHGNSLVRKRNFVLRRYKVTGNHPVRTTCQKYSHQRHYTVVIIPPTISNVEYTWEERLIHLEHHMIRAQSMAGLYSTLGGGYFMTRRLQTATKLAQEQMRLALVLGNREMYYKCIINQAYSEIYRGKFQTAKRHIVRAWIGLAYEKHFDEKMVLQNMCKSAMWFRKQVRTIAHQQKKGLLPSPTKGQSHGKTNKEDYDLIVDDFSRVRVVADQSSHQDLLVPPFVSSRR
jgi:hypothetical protein